MKLLRLLVLLADARWTRRVLVVLWILSSLYMVSSGWVRESWERASNGMEHRYNYFDIHRNYLFVWSTLILIAYFAHSFKRRSLGYYGVGEIAFGIVGGYLSLEKFPMNDTSAWLAILASAYVVVRGAGNISQAVKESPDNDV